MKTASKIQKNTSILETDSERMGTDREETDRMRKYCTHRNTNARRTLHGVVFRYCDINLPETRPVVDIVCLTNTACGAVAGKSDYDSNVSGPRNLFVFDLLTHLEQDSQNYAICANFG